MVATVNLLEQHIALLGPTIIGFAAIAAKLWRNGKKLQEVHVLVNSRLTEALDEIAALKAEVATLRERPKPPRKGTTAA